MPVPLHTNTSAPPTCCLIVDSSSWTLMPHLKLSGTNCSHSWMLPVSRSESESQSVTFSLFWIHRKSAEVPVIQLQRPVLLASCRSTPSRAWLRVSTPRNIRLLAWSMSCESAAFVTQSPQTAQQQQGKIHRVKGCQLNIKQAMKGQHSPASYCFGVLL